MGVSERVDCESYYELVGGVGAAGAGCDTGTAGLSAVLDVGGAGCCCLYADYVFNQAGRYGPSGSLLCDGQALRVLGTGATGSNQTWAR